MGLQANDVIIGIAERQVKSVGELLREYRKSPAATEVDLLLIRDQRSLRRPANFDTLKAFLSQD
jgi:hypothetical protein